MLGRISAMGAVAVGLLFAALAALTAAWNFGPQPFVFALAAVLLLVGAFRTLRKMSGGLRLLCGAWGLAAGLMLQPLAYSRPAEYAGSTGVDLSWLSVLITVLPFVCLIGLAMTVLHKEQK